MRRDPRPHVLPDPKVTIAAVADTLRRLNATFRTGKTRNLSWRRSQLERLRYAPHRGARPALMPPAAKWLQSTAVRAAENSPLPSRLAQRVTFSHSHRMQRS